MRWILPLLLAAAGMARADVIGHIRVADEEFEFYDNGVWCYDLGGMSVSKYRQGTRHPYVIGCWVALGVDMLRIRFKDGSTAILNKRQFVPVNQEPPPPRVSL